MQSKLLLQGSPETCKMEKLKDKCLVIVLEVMEFCTLILADLCLLVDLSENKLWLRKSIRSDYFRKMSWTLSCILHGNPQLLNPIVTGLNIKNLSITEKI